MQTNLCDTQIPKNIQVPVKSNEIRIRSAVFLGFLDLIFCYSYVTCFHWRKLDEGYQSSLCTIFIIISKYSEICHNQGFPGDSVLRNLSANAGDARDVGSIPGSGRSSGEGNDNPSPVFLPGESHGQRSLVGCSPWGRRVRHDWVTQCTHTS